MDNQTVEAFTLTASSINLSIVMLVNCLKKSGALEDDSFENALQATINAPGAEKDRLDYQMWQNLLDALQGDSPPDLRLIPGGKAETDE